MLLKNMFGKKSKLDKKIEKSKFKNGFLFKDQFNTMELFNFLNQLFKNEEQGVFLDTIYLHENGFFNTVMGFAEMMERKVLFISLSINQYS